MIWRTSQMLFGKEKNNNSDEAKPSTTNSEREESHLLTTNPLKSPMGRSEQLKRTLYSVPKAGSKVLGFFLGLIRALAFIAVGFVIGVVVMRFNLLSVPFLDIPQLSEDKTTITVQELQRAIDPASDLVSSRYRYTDAAVFNEAKQICNFDIELTRNLSVFTYSGVVGVGFDLSDVVINIDDDKSEIVIVLPELSVIQNEIFQDTVHSEYEQLSLFNQKGADYYLKNEAKLKERALDRALKDKDFMAEAHENAELVLDAFLSKANVDAYYTITYQWEETE